MPVALVGALRVVVDQPAIEVVLEVLYGRVERLAHPNAEELIAHRLLEALNGSGTN